MSLSLQYDTGLFSKGLHNNKHKPTLSYNWKNAIFDLYYPFLYHMFIFMLLLTYMMVSFMTVQEDFIGFFTHKQPGNPSYKMSKSRFFQVEFLCSVTLNLTFTLKYVILVTLAFVS